LKFMIIGMALIFLLGILGAAVSLHAAYKAYRQKAVLVMLAVIFMLAGLGYVLGMWSAYQGRKQTYAISHLRSQLDQRDQILTSINAESQKRLIFLHHSVGSEWLGQGRLAAELMKHGIAVHDATYGDEIGQNTDICHWLPKFRNDTQKIFRFDRHPNIYYSGSQENDIIMFKSCFPNSDIVAEGTGPGDPTDPNRTMVNFKAAFEEMAEEFAKYPSKLFIYVTAPPLVPKASTLENARRAREFNNWLKGEYLDRYRKDTGLDNLLVFDLFDVLADENNFLRKEFQKKDTDSHPNQLGGMAATESFIKFLKEKGVIERPVLAASGS